MDSMRTSRCDFWPWQLSPVSTSRSRNGSATTAAS